MNVLTQDELDALIVAATDGTPIKESPLFSAVDTAVRSEYDRAARIHGSAHRSAHEAYAVILEEFQEAVEEQDRFRGRMDIMWKTVRRNGNIIPDADKLLLIAINAAMEWVQVAAMCHKAMVKKEE
jgi:hypothetical protein